MKNMQSRSRAGRGLAGLVRSVAAAALLATVALPAKAQDLVVYSALDEDQFIEMMAAFEAKHPELRISKIIDSNGPMIARLLAEKDNPQADILFGAAVSGLLVLDQAGVLERYKPSGLENIKPYYIDPSGDPPVWVGIDAWADCICFNTAEGERLGIAAPQTWEDLLKPEYKGHITMPNPNSSGTGFLAVAGWLTLYGEEGGWAYMDKLHENIAQYGHSGSRPCRMAGAGEIPIGISYAFPGVKLINEGAPLQIILPKEGLGAEVEAVALVKGGKNPEAAKLLADWATSEESAIISNKYYPVIAYKGINTPIPNSPEGEEELMLAMDFNWLAANRDRILEEWQRRYGVKTEPKQ